MKPIIERHDTDILILGTGGAGLFAALHAQKAAPDQKVTIAVKGLIGKSGWPLLSDLIDLLNKSGFSSIILDDVLIASTAESLGTIAEDFSLSRTFTFEKLGGRMSLVTKLVKTLGLVTSTAFRIKHSKLFSKK